MCGPVRCCCFCRAAGFLSVDVDGRVVRLDTFAKLLGPGYRLGWVSGPPAIVQKLSLHFAAVSVGCCSLSQVRCTWHVGVASQARRVVELNSGGLDVFVWPVLL